MTERTLHLYHRLPPFLRSWAATLRGYSLIAGRYGAETERLVEEALERDCWSLRQWQQWQEAQLAAQLHRAATQVPYYREQWAKRRRRGDRASWEYLENWPVLSKDAVREAPEAFLVEGLRRDRLREEHTSGTTGKPLRLWRGPRTELHWYAIFEARSRRWNGVSRRDRWAIVGGRLVTPVGQEKPPFWVWNAAMGQLYMSSYHLAPRNAPAYLEALLRYRVRYLYGYASSLHSLALAVLEAGLPPPELEVAISNAEPLFPHQREAIERAFRCPARDSYGLTEMVLGGGECAHGRMHLWPDVGILEVLHAESDQHVRAGQCGRFVATGLVNEEMPLIRYAVGDSGVLAPDAERCSCGRSLPILAQLEGRMDDVIVTPDGRRVGRLDPVFKGDFAIREAQIIQVSRDSLRIRYVPANGFTDRDVAVLVARVKDRVGDMEVETESVESIPRSANGKFRAVISQL